MAVAACVPGLLVGIPSLAPTGPAVAQAAQPYPPHAAAPAGGMAGAVPRTGQGPTHDLLADAVRSTSAPDEQLDVAAALDRGTRLFFLGARYRDQGNGQADYYLAGRYGVSHQPLRELFAPLGTWLAAPGHEHTMVMLGFQTDPRSANPGRFDAACQAFTTALGPYLLKASDLPAGKSFGELTPDEQAALRSHPRVVTDWSACTGEQLPIARPQKQRAAAVPDEDHWMADQADLIGQRPLRQVVLPGSHDAATYDTGNCKLNGQVVPCWPQGPLETAFTEAQSQDITAQLNAGSRYFDLRFGCWDWADDPSYGFVCGRGGDDDYWVDHGGYLSRVHMDDVLSAITLWANQPAHQREILVLNISIDGGFTGNPNRLNSICQDFLWIGRGAPMLQPSMVPPNTTIYDMSINEIWALSGPRIITNWSDCTGQSWPPAPQPGTAATPYAGYYADGCSSAEIVDRLAPRLEGRLDGGGTSASPNLVTGLYGLQVSGTPEVFTCPYSVHDLAPQQLAVLAAIESWWYSGQHNAPANLNIIPGDFLGDPAGEAGWPIVQTALNMNRKAQAPQLYLNSDPTNFKPVTVTCYDPRGTPATLVVYPAAEGAQSPNSKTFTGAAIVQANLSVEDFPVPTGYVENVAYLSAECAQGAAPAQSSRIVIPLYAFGTLPYLGAIPAGPLDLPFTCFGAGPQQVQVTAYPAAAGPHSPDAQVFVSANQQPTLQATYSRRGSYDVRLDCLLVRAEATSSVTVPDSAFPPALTMRTDPKDRWLYCDRDPQLNSPATLSLAAQTPNAPPPLSVTGSGRTIILSLLQPHFPAGDYQLTATCLTSGTLPFTATPLTLSSSQIPLLKVAAEITGCKAMGSNVYDCALQVTLGPPLPVNTVASVGIGNGGFNNPSGGDSPQVTAVQNCQVKPIPSTYLWNGISNSYTSYNVNIGPGGCTTASVVTFGEAVTGAAGTTITQPVTVPQVGAGTASFVLP